MNATPVVGSAGADMSAASDPPPAVIGVVPGAECRRRARLFAALEAAYPVRFTATDGAGHGGTDALITFGDSGRDTAESGIPRLVFTSEERPAGAALPVTFSTSAAPSPPLRGARLTERHGAGARTVPVGAGDEIIARLDGAPAWVWAARGRTHTVALAPEELATNEMLRNRVRPGRSVAMLATVQFIRAVAGERLWELPSTRAAFVIDDPNLRAAGYGHLDYDQLLSSARRHGYHVSMAMVPLDAGRGGADPRAVALFREGREHLSLCIHGNDHDGGELGRPGSAAEALPVVAQALRRIGAFERRTGILVDRVMVAPHERMSRGTVDALRACGYEAFSGARPYPWITDSPDLDWLTRPSGSGPLIGSGSSELMPGGFPLLMRMDFGHSREELVIRAFLGQPVIVYGHHDVFAHGTDVLESFAAEINNLGAVHWSSLSGIARSAVETRRHGDGLGVRMLGRRVSVEVPPGVTEVRLDAARVEPSERHRLLAGDAAGETDLGAAPSATLPVTDASHASRLELRLGAAIDAGSIPAPRPRLQPVARRVVTRWRDRPQQQAGQGRG
ncbi:MAG: hypothetical protein ACXVR1_17440 [Solirubrobacteraceae bacterium]